MMIDDYDDYDDYDYDDYDYVHRVSTKRDENKYKPPGYTKWAEIKYAELGPKVMRLSTSG